jgi:hypothetical protein
MVVKNTFIYYFRLTIIASHFYHKNGVHSGEKNKIFIFLNHPKVIKSWLSKAA